MSLKVLRAKLSKTIEDMEALTATAEKEEREFTTDEQAMFDALMKTAEETKAKIGDAEKAEDFIAAAKAPRPAAAQTYQPLVRHANGAHKPREFESIGEFMSTVRFNPNDERLATLYKPFEPRGASDQRMDTGTAGGFAVPQQFLNEMRRAQPQGAIIRPRATVIPAGSPPDSPITMPALNQGAGKGMHGGVAVSWIGEGDAKPQTDAALRQITLTPHECAAHIKVTDKLLRNWEAASSFLSSELLGAVVSAEERAFYRGDGVNKPLGILSSAAAIAINRTTANTVKYADLANLMGQFYRGDGDGVFLYNQSVLPQLMRLVDDDGRLIWQASAREGIPGTILGMPAIETQHAPALGTKGDLVLASLKNYLIKDGSGPYVAASEHADFVNNKTVFKVFFNVDGSPWLDAPLLGEDSRSYSPFMVLDVPA
ncbi:MAG: phage major capsid protein [Bdellovibrionales bacterium]